MVKKITRYRCEICNEVYEDKKDADNCERKGVTPLYPIGMMFKMYGCNEIVFAIIKQHSNLYLHNHGYSVWACRDGNYRDNCGWGEFCGLDSWTKIYPPNKTIPAYKRMTTALKEAKITPSDYGDTI